MSPSGYCGHTVAQKNFKRLLLRARASNSFQLSRMNLKGVCWEVDWLFPIFTRGLLESETGPCELSAEFVFRCPGFQHDGPSSALGFFAFRFYRGSFAELGSCCAWLLPRRGCFSQVKSESWHHRCQASVCFSVLVSSQQ